MIKIKCPKCKYEFEQGAENKCPRCGAIVNTCHSCSGNCLKCTLKRS